MKYVLILVACCFALSSKGQDYFEYQRIFNRIDEDLLKENYPAAIQRLDSVYTTYDFIYARHCIKALQICCVAKDSLRADKFLAKCFRQGIPLWIIRTNELTSRSLTYSLTSHTVKAYDSLRAAHRLSINLDLARQIDTLIEIDQSRTDKVNNAFFLSASPGIMPAGDTITPNNLKKYVN